MRACAHAHTHERDVYTITEHCWRVCVKNEGGGKGVSFLLHRCSLSLYLRLNTTHTHTHTHAYLSSRTVSQAPTLPSSTSTCYLPLSSPFLCGSVSHLGSSWPGGTVPLGSASCQLQGDWWIRDSMAAPAGLLRGPVWGTGSIKHQASRTNGHALEAKREGWRERCAFI